VERRHPVGELTVSVHKGWYSRGYLPHLDEPGRLQVITFRLADSLPQTALCEIEVELADFEKAVLAGETPALRERLRADRRRKLFEKFLDRSLGTCLLRDRRVGGMIENALLHFDGERYMLAAWCVMPNHVHALINTKQGFPLANLVQSWKSFTAKEANRILERDGTFWQRDFFDRFIRDDVHLARVVEYIEQNPVKAGLVLEATAWPFSSARFR
jgi:putative transposase